jgi:hypothetical protein
MIAHSVLGEAALYALAACSVALASVFLGHYLAVQKYLASRLEPTGVCARAHVIGVNASPPPGSACVLSLPACARRCCVACVSCRATSRPRACPCALACA